MLDTIIITERLILRRWRDTDLQAMTAINQDPVVMEYFPAIKTLQETQAFINGNKILYDQVGYCFYATELKDSHELIGFVGLCPVYELPCAPAVEIGWRLGKEFWGKGYASEAANAVIKHAFSFLGIDELVSFTAATNAQSERLMQRLGFTRSKADDFAHPKIEKDHRLSHHIFYRLKKR